MGTKSTMESKLIWLSLAVEGITFAQDHLNAIEPYVSINVYKTLCYVFPVAVIVIRRYFTSTKLTPDGSTTNEIK